MILTLPMEELYEETNRQSEEKASAAEPTTLRPAELIQNGMNFLSELMTTLAGPSATKTLTQSLTEKDEKTGQIYLKIPIQNTDIVENALSFL